MQMKQKIADSLKLSAEQEAMITAAVESAGPIKPLNEHNVLEFNDHVKVQSVISKMGILIMETKNVAFKTERRKLLEDNKEAEYQKCIQQFQQQQKIVFAGTTKVALDAYKISMPVFQESTKHYM